MPTFSGKLGRRLRALSRLVRSRFTENSAVLLYHRIAEDAWDPFKLCVSPKHFAEQLDALPSLGKVLDIGEFVRRQREGCLEKGALCLTFDDGYVDFLENALPLLEERELPATIYCLAEGLGEPLWWDRLHGTLTALASDSPPISLESAAGKLDLIAGWTLTEAFDRLYAFFKALPPDDRTRQIDALASLSSETADASRRLMTTEEIASLAAHPLVTVGAHTLSHTSLAILSPDAQHAEISGSKRILSEIAGRPVTTFSYPYGLRGRDFDAATVEAARLAGFDHAFAADPGTVGARSDPMSLPRLWVHDSDGQGFVRKLRRWL